MINHEKHFQHAFIAGLKENGWVYSGTEGCSGYDRINAVIDSDMRSWFEKSQPENWRRLVNHLNGDASAAIRLIVEETVKFRSSSSDQGGTYNLLLNGIKILGIKFDFFQAEPATSGNVYADILFENMILRVVSELPYSAIKTHDAIDLGFFINGIPVGTAELKTPITGQGVGEAEKQYCEDRIPGKDLILDSSAGALFHLAVANDLASLTTALKGCKTQFIPFNTGIDNSDWANENPDEPATSYLWKQILEKKNFTLIISGMMRNVINGGVYQTRFPRYHQFDNLKKITDSVREDNGRTNYLSQHAPGSGKSDEIANLAYALSIIHGDNEKPLYSSVIIITNRTVLDDQIGELLKSKIRTQGYFQAINKEAIRKNGNSKSLELANNLINPSGPKIMSVTAQTFAGTLLDVMHQKALQGQRLDGSYAIIIDEAHDGETGKQHENMYKALLGVDFAEHEALPEDDSAESLGSGSATSGAFMDENMKTNSEDRANLPKLNFFAYTATPNADALRVFGEKFLDAHGNLMYVPFHTYSMRQAREEGYINDVLANYVTHDRFVKISIDDKEYAGDRIVDFTAGRKEVGKWIQTLPEVKEVIIRIIIQKMRDIVMLSLNGTGKAMLSCSSRDEAVAYKHLIDRAVAMLPEKDKFATIVAFSGSVYDPEIGDDVTELDNRLNRGLNGRQDLAKAFDDDKFRLMIVANKFQVGFDQPKLMCMFLDKTLKGINLVQTTARVNRKISGKEDVYIFDFVNSAEDVLETFRKFDEDAALSMSLDLSTITLDTLIKKTAEFGIHTEDEIEKFANASLEFSSPDTSDRKRNIASTQMTNAIATCSMRFYKQREGLDEKDQRVIALNSYKAMLKRFTTVYNLLSITRNETEAIAAIYKKYGKEANFFSSLHKALSVSRLTENASSVDVNALRLEKYEVVPQGVIGGLSAGDTPETSANYSANIATNNFLAQMGPIEVLINEINDYPELSTRDKGDVKIVVDSVMNTVESDLKLEVFAKSNSENSFVNSGEVHRKIMQSLTRLYKHKSPRVSIVAKTIMKKKENDSTVLRNIAKTVYKAFTTAPEEVIPPMPALDPDRHKNSKILLYTLVDSGFLFEGEEVLVNDPAYAVVGPAMIQFGGIRFKDNTHPSANIAAKYAKRLVIPDAEVPNGWEFWGVKRDNGTILKLSEVLDQYLATLSEL